MHLGIFLFLRYYEPIISALGFSVAIAAIFLLFYVERVRRPHLNFLDYDDTVTNDNVRDGFMWHHLKVQNSYPRLLLNRDAALSSMARVDFIGQGARVPQITAHWTNQPEPRLKFRGIGAFAVNPWIVYDHTLKPNPWSDRNVHRFHPKWEELRLNEIDYVVRVEVEAINLGKRQIAQYRLRITGSDVGDLQITRLEA